MLVHIMIAWIGLVPLLQAPVVEKLNGPLAGNVSRFTWTPDGRYVVYGAARDYPDIDVVTSLRVADRREAVYEPFPYYFYGSVQTRGFAFLPDPALVGVQVFWVDWSSLTDVGRPTYVLERSGAQLISTAGLDSRFLDDGRMLYRSSYYAYRVGTFQRAWVGRWDVQSTPIELSPPADVDNHVSLVLAAPRAGVAVFGWRDTIHSSNDAELMSVPLGGGVPVPLTPPAAGRLRQRVDVLHVRSTDELVIYSADEIADVAELWAVPVDGASHPRRLNPPLAPDRSLHHPTVSPDASRVLFVADVEANGVFELWSTTVDDGASVRLSGPMPPEGDVGNEGFWIAPDGSRAVYLADEASDGVPELFSVPIDGHAAPVRLHGVLPATFEALSGVHFTSDGRFVVFAVRIPRGAVLLSAPVEGGSARLLNWPFPFGGGVLEGSAGILSSVAIAPGDRHVFFLGEQDTEGVIELYSAALDGREPRMKWNAPLVPGGDVTDFATRPSPGAVLYRADQDLDQRFELYLSTDPDTPSRRAPSAPPRRTVSGGVPD